MNLISFFHKKKHIIYLLSLEHIIHFKKAYSHLVNLQVNSIGITSKLNVMGEYLM